MIMIMIMIMCLQLLPKGGEGWNSSRMTGLAAWNPPVSITLLLEVIINRQTDRETWYVSWDWAAQSNSTELTKCSGLMQSSRTPLCVILNLHVHTLPVYRSPHTTTVTGRGRVSWQPYMQYSSRFSLTWSVHGRLHAKRKRLRFYAIPEMHLTLIIYNGSPAIIQRKSINVLTFMDLSTSCCEKFVWSQSRNDDFSAHSLQGKSFTANYWYRIFHLCYFVRHFFHLDFRSCIFIVTSGSSVKQCRMSHLVSRRKCHRMIFS